MARLILGLSAERSCWGIVPWDCLYRGDRDAVEKIEHHEKRQTDEEDEELKAFAAANSLSPRAAEELKKLIYGRGGKKPKPDEACMHARRWGFDPANGDEADACGVWLITVQYQFPDAFNRVWLPKRSAAA